MTDDTKDIENKNVIRIVRSETPEPEVEKGIPVTEYAITDIDGETYTAEGFLLFTAQHVAVMRDDGEGAIPILVMPLTQVRKAVAIQADDGLPW